MRSLGLIACTLHQRRGGKGLRGGGKDRGVRQPSPQASERSLEVLRAVRDYWADNRCPPSVRELAGRLGMSSTSTFYYLNILERDGYIERHSKTGRCWVPVGIRISFDDWPG